MILVTGATGFIGDRLCNRIIFDGAKVRRAMRRADKQGDAVVGDIGPETNWSLALADVDCVVHLAARVHVMDDTVIDPIAEFRYVNVEGTLNLARQAVAAGVRRFVYLSSIKVNGEETKPGSAFTSEDLPAPIDPYGVSKYEAEQGLMALAKETNMEVVVIRPPLVYGPHVKANFLNMMKWLSNSVPLPFGSIQNKRSLVALDNLVDLIMTCIKHPAAVNQVFLVSDDEDLSTTELLQRTAAALHKKARLFPVPLWPLITTLKIIGKANLAQRLCGSLQVDIEKTKKLLGWTPLLSVDEGLKGTAEIFLQESYD